MGASNKFPFNIPNIDYRLLFTIFLLSSSIIAPILVYTIPESEPRRVGSLISINLNGSSKGNLSANLLLYNETIEEYYENIQIKQLIVQDLAWISDQFTDLEEISVYEYQNSTLPGTVCMLLVNSEHKDRSFYRRIKEMMTEDSEHFWYIDSLELTYLPKDSIETSNAYTTGCIGTYWGMFTFGTFDIISKEAKYTSQWEVSFSSNGTMMPTSHILQGENWTFNHEFNNTLYNEIKPLENKISGIISIDIRFRENSGENISLEDLNIDLNETLSYHDAETIGSVEIILDIEKSSTKQNRVVLRVFEEIISRLWYVKNFDDHGCEDVNWFLLLFLGKIPITAFAIVVFPLTSIKLIRRRRRTKLN